MLAYVDRLIVGALKANSLKHSCPVLLSLHRSTYSDRNGCNIVGLSEDDFTEKFVRGSGPGGQSINKTSNCVKLKHVTGVMVSCQETRDLKTNRKIARRILRDKLELIQKGAESKLGKRMTRIRKRKYNAARRAKKKYGAEDGCGGDEAASPRPISRS